MAKLIMMVGIPASGKTTYAKTLAERTGAVWLSSDDIRKEFDITKYDAESTKFVFGVLHERMTQALSEGKNVIHDATNVKRWDRAKALNAVPRGTHCEAVIMATPVDVCLERNRKRADSVPDYVIEKMVKNFQVPVIGEGFDSIKSVKCTEDYKPYVSLVDVCGFKQDNPYHAHTLDAHIYETFIGVYNTPTSAFDNIEDKGIVMSAASLHDIGKVVTKTFVNTKGETTKTAHYYGHEHVGAYIVLSEPDTAELWDDSERYDVAVLVDNHMRPMVWHDVKSKKAKQRDIKLLGENVCNNLEILYRADRGAK